MCAPSSAGEWGHIEGRAPSGLLATTRGSIAASFPLTAALTIAAAISGIRARETRGQASPSRWAVAEVCEAQMDSAASTLAHCLHRHSDVTPPPYHSGLATQSIHIQQNLDGV